MKLRTVREDSITSKTDFPTVVRDGNEVKLVNGGQADDDDVEPDMEARGDDLDGKLAIKRQEEGGGPPSLQS